MVFGLTPVDIQAWLSSIGVLLTGVVAVAAFLSSLRNGRHLRRVERDTKADAATLIQQVIRIEVATNGMKRELEAKAFQDGVRSVDTSGTRVALIAQATEAAVTAAKIVTEAAQTAATNLVIATEVPKPPGSKK